MALTGKFLADFESFYAAVQKAEVQLKGLETGAGKVSNSLNRMVDNFSGRKLIQDATVMAEAVERIGGASKLTEAEQAKVNRTITEALAKYKALGQEAPQAMRDLEQATRKVVTETANVSGKAPQFFGELTSQVKATALGFVGAQAVIGGVTTAFHTMTDFIGSSIKSYADAEAAQKKLTAALTAQGFATPTVIKQYDALATQFQKTTVYSDDLINEMQALLVQVGNVMPSQMNTALKAATDLASGLGIDLRTATMLVGKAFEGETGTLKKYGVVIDEATLKARGMPAVLDAIQAKFGGQASAEVETYSGKIKQLTNDWDNFKEAVGKAIVLDPTVIAVLNLISKGVSGAGGATGGLARAVELAMGQSAGDVVRFADAYAASMNRVEAASKELEERTFRELPKVAADAWKQMIPTGIAQQVSAIAAAYKPLTEEQKKAADAATAHASAIRALAEAYSGASAIKAANDAIAAVNINLKAGTTIAQMTREQQDSLNKTVEASIRAYESAGRVVPPVLRSIYAQTLDITKLGPKIEDIGTAFKGVGEQIKVIEPFTAAAASALVSKLGNEAIPAAVKHLGDEVEISGHKLAKMADEDIQKAIDKSAEMRREFGELVHILDGVAAAFGGTFGKIVTGAADVVEGIGNIATATSKLDAIAAAIDLGVKLQPLLGLRHGWLGDVLGTNRDGRVAVEQFAELHGGFDRLHDDLLKLGDTGEAVWKRLTQVVGKSNPAQAAEEIAKAQKLLDDAAAHTPEAMASASGYKTIEQLQQIADQARTTYEYMRDSGKYTAAEIADAFQKSKDAQIAALGDVSRATADALAKLDSEYKSLSDSVGQEAEEAVMGVVETQQRARMAEIERERKALEEKSRQEQESARETGNKVEEEGKAAHDRLQEYYKAHPLVMPGYVSISGDPTSGSRGSGIQQSGGGTIQDADGNTVATTGTGSGGGGRRFATGTPGLGFVDFGKESPAWLHGKEAVVPQSRVGDLAQQIAAAMPSAGGSAQPIIVQTYLDGRKIAESVTPHLPREVHRLGLVRV